LTTVGLDCEITGWGLINKTHPTIPDKLQVLQIVTGNWSICKAQRPRNFRIFHICAGIQGVLNKGICFVSILLKWLLNPI